MQRVTVVPAGQSPRRLDVFVSAQSAGLSRAAARRWIDGGLISVNGRRAKAAQRIRPGDVIASHVAVRAPVRVEPEAIPLQVLHEDESLLIVNKPAGLVMHPGPGNWTGTLLNALVHHVRGHVSGPGEPRGGWDTSRQVDGHMGVRTGGSEDTEPGRSQDGLRARPGLVHRLDKGTSGVLAVAKTDAAHRHLSRQFRAHSVSRMYLALVAGAVRRGGVIDQPLGRDLRDRRHVSGRTARPHRAVTEFRVAERLGAGATLVEVYPRTGRMHQIRVHLAALGHPVLGDAIYGAPGADPALDRPMLHAAVLGFDHPATGARVEYRAGLPPDMARALAARGAKAGLAVVSKA